MNLCKRACLYSIRKKGKTLTLLAFLLVMATLMLTCLSIQSATETANANIKKALLGYFTINAKTLENGIPEDTQYFAFAAALVFCSKAAPKVLALKSEAPVQVTPYMLNAPAEATGSDYTDEMEPEENDTDFEAWGFREKEE